MLLNGNSGGDWGSMFVGRTNKGGTVSSVGGECLVCRVLFALAE